VTRAGCLVVVALVGCDWDLGRMNDQPRCEPGDRTPWLPDGRCDQPTPFGAVPWRSEGPRSERVERSAPSRLSIARGADRFRRFCAPCHGMLGDADAPIARDMTLRPPPSLHATRIVGYPDELLYDVIGGGYGMMPAYASQIAPADRWAIVHYVRVLQRSQGLAVSRLPLTRLQEAKPWLQ
jgi:mono/diheme cytochrome c family protein